ncbi:uncharacterized protein LOC123536407 isoform X2 [Mercenaria mercenaria]|uniref:uncharacterized protein LOC123536407 isoform X2 n=1 Tax=Mercenaria mercenaria TaxID=6596 RepID=UPI00234F180B|nr:uncharacterized protein LOC123536407 isoform X2 [Mercenaria mercenaria]
MDPELYRNTLASRYANQDISSLLSEQAALTPGIGLGTTFPTAGQISAARSFGPLPGYTGHALHTDSHLQNIAAQGAYKTLPGQPTFSDPYAGLRLTSQSSSIPSSKPVFGQESMAQAGMLDAGQKWGLSNFVAQNPNMLAHAADLSSAEFQSSLALSSQTLLNPPPAHSSKTNQISQRLPYSGAEMVSRTTKSPPGQSVYDSRNQSGTPISSQAAMFAYSHPQAFHAKQDILMDTMNYEAVSPATTPGPDPSNQHQQQNESYLSLQDLASISSTQQKLDVNNPQQSIQKRPSPIVPDRQNKMQHLKNQKSMTQQELFNGSPHMRQSPQQTNIGSPQVQMGSPQAPVPSSTIVQAPPPVQAPADSTTKPKKSRSRKKKDTINEMKGDNLGQNYNPQTVLNTPDMSQRVGNNEYSSMPNQTSFMPNRNQQVFSSSSESGHNSPLLTSPISQPLGRGQANQQTIYAKNVPSPNMSNHQARPVPQQSPMMTAFHPSPTNTQSGMTFSVSDALEMSREAVFANQGLIEGYSGMSEQQQYGMQESFTSQLGMESMRRPDMYNGAEESVFVSQYGGQFVSPNSVLNMDVGQVNNMNQQTTIDEAEFSSLMGDPYERDGSPEKRPSGDKNAPYYSLTVKVEAAQDDDLSHLAKPVQEKTDSKPRPNPLTSPFQSHLMPQSTASSQPTLPPPVAPKPVVKNASGGTSFMDSFLSFIQGKKPETLSSMSSAIIHNKPQLPKYIPEPPRPKRVEPTPEKSAGAERVNLLKTCDKTQKTSVVTFSDSDENTDEADSNAVKKAISALNSENENVQIRTNKLGGLTMKINLNKVKRAEENARKAAKLKKPRSRKKSSKEKKFGLKEEFKTAYSSGEEVEALPARQLSSRKAKENIGKYAEEEDSDSDTLKPIRKLGEESDDEKYDSDKDPAWTPFNVDKNVPAFDAADFDGKRKRTKGKSRSRQPKMRKMSSEGVSAQPVKVGEPQVVELDSGSEDEQPGPMQQVPGDLQVGDFVIEKNDEKNTESYSIWKIEPGRMLHKFELFTENSRILHRSIPTFSSWLPNMRNTFKRIRVRQVFKQGEKEHVEVLEEYRPKPALDSKLEQKYEEHPLVDAFNVYLQIFLSQALEPGFLSAIREADERFYLDALEKIDKAVGLRLTEIDQTVRWKDRFKESVKLRPHIREIDRPNLKQSCQACEFNSQPAIKSVHLFGNPYDRFSLQELPPEGPHTPMEFMIGKTAAKYVKPYHNLYHFKYNLFKRCLAKVNILQDSKAGDNAAILDQCLQNRTWVLQIFEDLKKMLEKG